MCALVKWKVGVWKYESDCTLHCSIALITVSRSIGGRVTCWSFGNGGLARGADKRGNARFGFSTCIAGLDCNQILC